jgi:hypothetical protein
MFRIDEKLEYFAVRSIHASHTTILVENFARRIAYFIEVTTKWQRNVAMLWQIKLANHSNLK